MGSRQGQAGAHVVTGLLTVSHIDVSADTDCMSSWCTLLHLETKLDGFWTNEEWTEIYLLNGRGL